jgi:hypothetical protein
MGLPITNNFRACTVNYTEFCIRKSNIYRRIRSRFKKALAREIGAQGVLFDEKKSECQKSCDNVPLMSCENMIHRSKNFVKKNVFNVIQGHYKNIEKIMMNSNLVFKFV